ncbi:MAG: signal peptidase [Bryobacterales bacterium]|jgi:signal peptidase II|nr:signal peptidase [Bryobacterales bacterium]
MPDRRLIAFVTAIGVFAADRWSKSIVENRFDASDTKIVIPGFFNIVRSSNPGVAFGILSDNTSHQRTFLLVAVSIVAVLILAFMLWRVENQDRSTIAGLALIFGGALGNVYDRAVAGTVTDFLDFHAGAWHWYVFNLADSAICIGAGLLILSMLISNRKESGA